MKKSSWIFLTLSILLSCSQKEKPAMLEEKTVAEANDLPEMQITLVDGKTIDAKAIKGKAVLVLFQPECDHCQHEAEDIEHNLAAFRDHTLYFVSSADQASIQKFANDYKLSGIPNVLFGFTSSQNVLNNFGPVQAPSVYIYSQTGKLVQHFNGQVDVGVILKYL